MAVGSILLLAVHVRLALIRAQPAGLILLATGLAWLWLPVRCKGDVARAAFHHVMSYLEWDAGHGDRTRCSLAELLGPGAATHDAATAEADQGRRVR